LIHSRDMSQIFFPDSKKSQRFILSQVINNLQWPVTSIPKIRGWFVAIFQKFEKRVILCVLLPYWWLKVTLFEFCTQNFPFSKKGWPYFWSGNIDFNPHLTCWCVLLPLWGLKVTLFEFGTRNIPFSKKGWPYFRSGCFYVLINRCWSCINIVWA